MESSKYARQQYSQAVLSGWSGFGQPEQESSDNPQSTNQTVWEMPRKFWEQKRYILFIPVVIEPAEPGNADHECKISIPLDVDIPVRVFRTRSKTLSQFTSYLPAEENKDTSKLCLVSGVSAIGERTLSPAPLSEMGQAIAYVYSRVLGIANRAYQCYVHVNERRSNKDDEGGSNASTSASGHLVEYQKTRRSKAIRGKVRDEGRAEDSPQVVSVDG